MGRKQNAFRCPHCGHLFLRHTWTPLKGTTRCPECRERFSRSENLALEQRMSLLGAARDKRHRRIRAFTPPAPEDTIRGDKIPYSIAEAQFKAQALRKGWKPHRPSWPDYLVETEFGFIGVEVKDKDDVSPTQSATFTLLEEAGLPVYVWRRDAEFLRRWKPPTATGDVELSQPRPHDRTARRRGGPGEDPKGEGDSPTGRNTQGEQYPGKSPRATAAGPASAVAKSTRRP